jgi:uncharacterized protein YidB (DUF937 family)
MKKIVIGALIGIVLFAAFGAAGYAFALFTNPSSRYAGYGMMGSRGGMMGGRFDRNDYWQSNGEGTQLHESMISALAAKLSLSADDLQSRLDKGETLTQIATSAGIDSSKLESLVTEAHSSVLDQAVKDGTLTQAQADWMKQRGGGMMFGNGRGGWFSDGRDCPCLDGDDEK